DQWCKTARDFAGYGVEKAKRHVFLARSPVTQRCQVLAAWPFFALVNGLGAKACTACVVEERIRVTGNRVVAYPMIVVGMIIACLRLVAVHPVVKATLWLARGGIVPLSRVGVGGDGGTARCAHHVHQDQVVIGEESDLGQTEHHQDQQREGDSHLDEALAPNTCRLPVQYVHHLTQSLSHVLLSVPTRNRRTCMCKPWTKSQ